MGTRATAAADEALIEAHFAGRLAREQFEAILDRVTEDGRRVRDIPDDEVWADDSPLSELEALIWERHEGAKPENIEARLRKLSEFNARTPEPELPIVTRQTIVDEDLGTTTRQDVRRTPSGRLMLCGSTTTTRALSEREHAELERRTRRRSAHALAAASARRAMPRRRGTGTRPAARRVPTTATTSTSSSSSSSGDGGDSDPPAEPASVSRSLTLAPSRLTVREVRARIVADLVAQHGLRATVAVLDRAGWPIATRALAYRDAGVEEAR